MTEFTVKPPQAPEAAAQQFTIKPPVRGAENAPPAAPAAPEESLKTRTAKSVISATDAAWNALASDFAPRDGGDEYAADSPGMAAAKRRFDSEVGAGKTILDAMSLVFAPVRGAAHELVARPVARATGIPEGVAEFVTDVAGGGGATKLTSIASAPRRAPIAATLKEQARAAFDAAKQAGLSIKSGSFDNLTNEIAGETTRAGFAPAIHPAADAVLQRMAAAKGKDVSYDDIFAIREMARDAARDPQSRRIGAMIQERIDNYMEGLQGKDVNAGNPQAAADAMSAGKEMWKRAKHADIVDQAIDRAKLSARRLGFDNALRREFETLARNERKMQGFSPEEAEAIRTVATGGLVRNGFSRLANLSPMAQAIYGALAGGSTFVGGGGAKSLLAGGASSAASVAAKPVARRLTSNAAGEAADAARAGNLEHRAADYGELADKIRSLNSDISQLLQSSGLTTVPKPGSRIYPQFKALRDERDATFREMRAMPRAGDDVGSPSGLQFFPPNGNP